MSSGNPSVPSLLIRLPGTRQDPLLSPSRAFVRGRKTARGRGGDMEREEMKRLYLEHREVEEARDLDAVVATFDDDCFLETLH